MPSFLHSGDLGDAIYGLPVIRALGGGELFFASRPWTRMRWSVPELTNLRGLFEAQDYIERVALHDGESVDHDLSTFRNGGYKLGDTIFERQRRWLRAEASLDPWLTVSPEPVSPIVVARAPRWQGYCFPWGQIIAQFGDLCVFVGLFSEHQAFVREFGFIPYCETPDLFALAGIVAGCELFIGSQSAALALANALGKDTLVEVCPHACDCFYPRGQYCIDGEVTLSFRGRKIEIPPPPLRDPGQRQMVARAKRARAALTY
jgi:hypothetical protein